MFQNLSLSLILFLSILSCVDGEDLEFSIDNNTQPQEPSLDPVDEDFGEFLEAHHIQEGINNGDYFGTALSTGDVNGDGAGDVQAQVFRS